MRKFMLFVLGCAVISCSTVQKEVVAAPVVVPDSVCEMHPSCPVLGAKKTEARQRAESLVQLWQVEQPKFSMYMSSAIKNTAILQTKEIVYLNDAQMAVIFMEMTAPGISANVYMVFAYSEGKWNSVGWYGTMNGPQVPPSVNQNTETPDVEL